MRSHKLLYALLASILLCITLSYAQETTSPRRVVGSFLFSKQVYTYEFTKEGIDNYSFIISSTTDSTRDTITAGKLDYILDEFTQNKFKEVFLQQMTGKFKSIDTAKLNTQSRENLKKELGEKSIKLFITIQSRLEFLDDEPVTANLILKQDRITSILRNRESQYYTGKLTDILSNHYINKVTVETEDGTIKNISAHLLDTSEVNKGIQNPRKPLVFKNIFPISISSKNDPERIANVKLYCINCGGIPGLTRYFHLSDLIFLDIIFENDKDDYSPSNRTVTLSPQSPVAELKKEKRSKIIEVASFSDFVGFDEQQPNGLIQIEAKRKININTNHGRFLLTRKDKSDFFSDYNLKQYKTRQLTDTSSIPGDRPHLDSRTIEEVLAALNDKKKTVYRIWTDSVTQKVPKNKEKSDTNSVKDSLIKYAIIDNTTFHTPYFVHFSSIEPRLLISKLEDNNRYLILNSKNSEGNKVSALDFYRHQLVSLGITTNVYKAVFPQSKLTWNILEVGAFWFRTRVKEEAHADSTYSEAVNNSYWSVNTNLHFRPDTRWSFSTGFTYLKQQVWNTLYKPDHKNGFLQLGLDGSFKTGGDSRMFVRYRWTLDAYDLNRNFTQFQLGYSMNIFANKSTEKQPS